MARDVSKFKIGEVIEGAWMKIQIAEKCEESGLITAVILGFWPIVPGASCGKKLKFLPQERISASWMTRDLPAYPLVLCLRADGVKVLG